MRSHRLGLIVVLILTPTLACGGDKKKEAKKEVWTDIKDASLPVDFQLQGEYAGKDIGVQVIALGGGPLHAVVYRGGLPGAGWDGKARSLMQGAVTGGKATFEPATGKRKYIAQKAEDFSATAKFPPAGHEDFTADIADGVLTLKGKGGSMSLKRIVRESPSMGMAAPKDAVVLFDGKDTGEWNRGRLDNAQGILNTDGGDILTKKKFNNYTMHLEFMLPYRPDARGQGRGNSGFYQVQHYEVQILDSFGLEGKDNECGGIYTKVTPKLNMCLPPLQWQTYDVDFTNAVRDDSGKKVKNARVTVRLNGVVIHDNAEIAGPTGGHRSDPEGTPGPILLQGHGNPLQFRNIWIVEKK